MSAPQGSWTWHVAGTVTGRFSSSKPNMQQTPRDPQDEGHALIETATLALHEIINERCLAAGYRIVTIGKDAIWASPAVPGHPLWAIIDDLGVPREALPDGDSTQDGTDIVALRR